jgi:hypothetical protein
MALMIPDSIPAKASQGEKTLYNILREQLPADFYVWYEPKVKQHYPDLLFLAQVLGYLSLKSKVGLLNRL